jgi:hypothetical protein
MFLLGFVTLRITEPIRTIQTVPVIDDKDLHSFIKTNSPAVIFFGNRSYYEFASFTVYRYRKHFKFGFSTETGASSLNISNFPVVGIFNGSSRVSLLYSGNSVIELAQQCQSHLWYSFPRVRLFLSDELRQILATQNSMLFGIDRAYSEPFSSFRNDVSFFALRHELFQLLGLNLSSGYYAYRGVDRNLVRIPDTKVRSYREYLKTPLIRFDSVNFTNRPFVCGFVIDQENDTKAEEQIRIMKVLAPKFQEMSFAPLIGQKVKELNETGNFIVWKDEFVGKRWILNDQEIWNETLLANKLIEITTRNHTTDTENLSEKKNLITKEL